jgi:hypothetical protein
MKLLEILALGTLGFLGWKLWKGREDPPVISKAEKKEELEEAWRNSDLFGSNCPITT